MKNKLIFLFFGMVVIGCVTDPANKVRKEFNKGYWESHSHFDSSLVSIFPSYVYEPVAGYIGFAQSSYKYY